MFSLLIQMSEVLMYYEIISAYEGGSADIAEEISHILAKYSKNTETVPAIISDLSNIYNTAEYLPLNVSDLPIAMKYWAQPSTNSSTYIVIGYPIGNPPTLKPCDTILADSTEQALAQCILLHKPNLLDIDQETYESFLQETPCATFNDLINFYLMDCYYDDAGLTTYLGDDSYAHIIF